MAKPLEVTERRSGLGSVEPVKPDINVDSLLDRVVGANGLWQWSIVMLLVFSTPSTPTFPVFANSIPEKRCRMEPELELMMEKQNLSFQDMGQWIGPWYATKSQNKTTFVGCERYKRNWTQAYLLQHVSAIQRSERTLENHLELETEPCPFGYVFQVDSTQYPGSVIAEFGTVCDTEWLAPLGTSIYMVGMMCGFLVSGWSSDRFGRKPVALFMTLVEIVSAIGISLSQSYISYTIFRGFSGLANMGRIAAYDVLALELTLARYRSYFIAVLALGHDFLMRALLSLVAFYISNWRLLNAVITAPALLGVLQLCFLSESPRWLISRDKLREAVAVLRYGYKLNHIGKRQQESMELIDLDQAVKNWISQGAPVSDESTKSKPKKVGMDSLKRTAWALCQTCSTPKLALTTILGIILFTAHSLLFYGLLLYANTVRGNVYIVSFVNASMAIPGVALAMVLYRFIRRRRLPLITLFLVSFVVLLVGGLYTYIVQPEKDIVLTVTANIAVICLVGCMLMLFIYLPELYPSTMRSQGFGIVSGLGQTGSIVCIFINELDNKVVHGLPILIYAGVTLIAIGSLFALQDTRGENLADFVMQVEPERIELSTEMTSRP
ncbi:Solute carrier family 22 member 1 [Fasciola hepatica]|uniref:Solute carrier family 22 member 1 n=1 Tax=Fasciola hepatica TaxID=6192 RepID=A0A2H1CS22_FASHE|nr:Solute carrier family 22 member 1 [Fasciola hepatica]